MDIDIKAFPIIMSYGIVFSIVTAIFVYTTEKKKGDINNLTRKWKKCRDKLQKVFEEINFSEGVEALRKSVGKVRAILSPYYGYAPIALNGSVIDDIITKLNNESNNANLESLKLKTVQTIDRVSKSAWEHTEREINCGSLTINFLTMVMLNFFIFTTWYVLKNYSLYLLCEYGIKDERVFSNIFTYLMYCDIIANVIFVFILWRNCKHSKKPKENVVDSLENSHKNGEV